MTTPAIRGNGFRPDTGGFASIIVGDRAYTPEEIVAALKAKERVEELEAAIESNSKALGMCQNARCAADAKLDEAVALLRELESSCSGPLTPMSEGDTRLVRPPSPDALRKARWFVDKMKGEADAE